MIKIINSSNDKNGNSNNKPVRDINNLPDESDDNSFDIQTKKLLEMLLARKKGQQGKHIF